MIIIHCVIVLSVLVLLIITACSSSTCNCYCYVCARALVAHRCFYEVLLTNSFEVKLIKNVRAANFISSSILTLSLNYIERDVMQTNFLPFFAAASSVPRSFRNS